MKHPQNYLLEKIINGRLEYPSLGKLNCVHVEDISNVMKNYAEELVVEVIERLNNGESFEIKGKVYRFKKL